MTTTAPATRIVVVGGVAGGMSCAARARRLDEHARIVVLEKGSHVSFANCGLPYYVGGEIEDAASLLVQTPASLHAALDLEIHVDSEMVSLDTDRRVVVVEDLVSTGGSSARAVEAVREAAGVCGWCLAIFSYGLAPAEEAFAALEPACKVRSLLTFDVLQEVAREQGLLTDDQLDLLDEWREDPFGWGARHGFPKVEKA